jgi:hypothetical protein
MGEGTSEFSGVIVLQEFQAPGPNTWLHMPGLDTHSNRSTKETSNGESQRKGMGRPWEEVRIHFNPSSLPNICFRFKQRRKNWEQGERYA